MEDVLSLIFGIIDVESALSFRQVSKGILNLFYQSLKIISLNNDLHPCQSSKEFITAYAHQRRTWRLVPTFSLHEKVFYYFMKNRKKLNSDGNPLTLHKDKVLDDSFYYDREFYKPMLIYNFSIHYPEGRSMFENIQSFKVKGIEDLIKNGLNKITGFKIYTVLTYIALTGKHSLLKKLHSYIKTAPQNLKISCFKTLIVAGVSPYYLKAFMFCGNIIKDLNTRNYTELIYRHENEFLLKKKLLEEKRGFVSDDYKWTRGKEICKKYRERNYTK